MVDIDDGRGTLVDVVCHPCSDDVLHDLFKAELLDEPSDFWIVPWSNGCSNLSSVFGRFLSDDPKLPHPNIFCFSLLL